MGAAVTALKRSQLGLGPWDVLNDGIARHSPLDLGLIGILSGLPILVFWWPLRQRPGVGTVANVLLIGFVVHRLLPHTSPATDWPTRTGLLILGLVTFALGQGLYLGAGLGAGPRDGLMTGLNARLGWSIRAARTFLESTALVGGALLGGSIGVGTIVFALGIGPMVQVTMRWFGYPFDSQALVGHRAAEAIGLAGD